MSEHGVLDGDRVRFRRLLPGPIERVWAYLTDPEKRGRWLAAGEMELRVGGRVCLEFRHADLSPVAEATPDRYAPYAEARAEGRVTACEPPHLLSYTWSEEEDGDSEVTFELSPKGEQVLLVLTHRRLRDRAAKLSVSAGWHTHLDVLADRLADRDPPPYWSAHAKHEQAYDELLPAEPAPKR